MNLLERIRNAAVDVYRNRLDSCDLTDLEVELQRLGLEISCVDAALARPKKRRKPNVQGINNYWDIIKKIEKKEGLSRKEARARYTQLQAEGKFPKKSRLGTSAKKSQGQIKYHATLTKIMKKNNCDKSQARQIYMSQKA